MIAIEEFWAFSVMTSLPSRDSIGNTSVWR